MTELDSRIILGGVIPQINDPLDVAIKGQIYGNSLLKRRADEQAGKRQNMLSVIAQGSVKPDGTMDRAKLISSLMKGGFHEEAKAADEGMRNQMQEDRLQQTAHIDNAIKTTEHLQGVFSAARTQDDWNQGLQLAESLSPGSSQRLPKQFTPENQKYVLDTSMTHKQKMEEQRLQFDQMWKQKDQDYRAYNDQAYRDVSLQGQQMNAATSERNFQNSIMQDIPPTHKMAYIGNQASIKQIDDAITKIRSYPQALGIGNYAGEAITQRSDPDGVAVRAALGNIAAVKRHDLSGAAISASETPFLQTFIPAATDDAETAIKKLEGLKAQISDVNTQISSTYNNPKKYRDYLPPDPVQPAQPTYDEAQVNRLMQKFGRTREEIIGALNKKHGIQ